MKLALRGLRRLGREGEANELDLSGTIRTTARECRLARLQMRPERRNKIKVLLLLDIGGSMDDHVEDSRAQLFSAARSEFKHLETFYFHNCPYERLWRTNRRRSRMRRRPSRSCAPMGLTGRWSSSATPP